MSPGTHTNESRRKCKRVTAHMWTSHGTPVNESWPTHKWVWYMCEWVIVRKNRFLRHVGPDVCMYMHVQGVCVYIRMCVNTLCILIYTHMCIHTYICTCICVHVYIKYTHTHTRTLSLSLSLSHTHMYIPNIDVYIYTHTHMYMHEHFFLGIVSYVCVYNIVSFV